MPPLPLYLRPQLLGFVAKSQTTSRGWLNAVSDVLLNLPILLGTNGRVSQQKPVVCHRCEPGLASMRHCAFPKAYVIGFKDHKLVIVHG